MSMLSFIFIAILLAFNVYFRPGHCEPLSFEGDLMGSGRSLFCLCNDNNHCIINKPNPGVFTNENNNDSAINFIGRCETSQSGRCYTVKEVNIDSLKSKIHRRRKSLFNESPSIFLTTPSPSTSNLSTTDSQNLAFNRFIRIRFGCLPSDERTTLTCNGHLSNHLIPKAIQCCNSSDFCNAGAVPNFHHHKTDSDAITSALQNFNSRRMEIHQKRLLRLNPVMNIGPDLLSGGKPLKTPSTVANFKPHTAKDYPKVTRIVFIVAFVVVFGTLMVTLTCVFIVYKSGVRKHRQMMYDSVQWIPNRSTNKNQMYPSSKKNILLDNGVSTRPSESCVSKGKLYVEQMVGNGPSLQTSSTESTRTTNTANEKPYTSGCCYDLIQQTLSKQMTLIQLLGRGRFSEVWSGSWRGEPVTVKLYSTQSRLSDSIWRRVVLLHRSMLLRHQSVQGLMAIDSINWPHQLTAPTAAAAGAQRVMVIAEWIHLGSLKDLMANFCWSFEVGHSVARRTRPWDWGSVRLVRCAVGGNAVGEESLLNTGSAQAFISVLLRMAHSLTQGLCFLHTEFAGTRGKPALAHRDLKPANVLIRPDWTCCLADLGLAVRQLPASLPVSQADLQQLYRRYADQLQSPSSGLESGGHPAAGDAAQEPMGDDDLERGGGQPTALPGLSMEEVEQLDWWPIGGLHCGTPRYLAPEVLHNSIDPFCFTAYQKADIYALGLILWEMITWSLSVCHSRLDSGTTGGGVLTEDATSQSNCSATLRSGSVEHCPGVTSTAQSAVLCPIPSPPNWPPHQPVFQEEWQRYLGQNHLDSYTSCDWFLQDTAKQMLPDVTGAGEPDVQAMRHLVCSLRLRPRLPPPPAWWLYCRFDRRQSDLLHQQQQEGEEGEELRQLPHESEDDQGVELVSEGNSERLHSCPRHLVDSAADRHPRTSSTIDTHPTVPSASCSNSSSSSGASSLNDPSPCSSSSSDRTESHRSRLVKVIDQLTALLPECWSQNPDARLTALRVRKNLQRIADQLERHSQTTADRSTSQQRTTATVVVFHSPNADIQQCNNSSSSNTIKAF